MHSDCHSAVHRSVVKLVGAVSAGDDSRWVAVRFSNCFFRGFRKAAVFENQSRWFRDGKPVVQARPLHFVSLNRAGAMPSLSWCGQQFAPPNNGMHRTHPARFIGLKADCVVLASPVMPAVRF